MHLRHPVGVDEDDHVFIYIYRWASSSTPRVVVCVAVCCSVLQCVAVGYTFISHHISSIPRVVVCVAVCCSVLRCVAVCCSVLQWVTHS